MENKNIKKSKSNPLEIDSKYRQITENISDIVWTIDMNMKTTYISPSVEIMFGESPEVHMEKTLEEKFTPDSLKILQAVLSEELEKEKDQNIDKNRTRIIEVEHYRANGDAIWISMHASFLRGEDGNIIGCQGVSRDITERKNIEEKLKQSEEKYQLLFNKAPLGYQSLDFDGRFIDVNQKWIDTLGYTKNEVVGKWFGDFLCPEYVEAFRKRFPIFKAQGYIHSEFEMLNKDGQRITILFEGKIGYSAGGEFKQTHCILQDITNQRQAEKALMDSEERYRNLFEYSGVGIGYYTPDGVVISYNKKTLEYIGGKLEDYIGKSIRDIFSKEEAKEFFARVKETLLSKQPLQYEVYVNLISGPKWFSSTMTKVMNATGQFNGLQVVSIDITERKQTEEKIKQQNELFASLLKLLPVGVFMVDSVDGKPLVVNDMGIALLGSGILPDTNEHNLSEVYKAYKIDSNKHYPTSEMPIVLGMKGISSHIDDMVVEHPDGSKKLLEVFGTPVKDEQGKPWASLVTFIDITERKKAESELIYLSYHDHLTGFYNRRYFEQELKRLDTTTNLPLSIIICDINGLKLINDSFGHDFGDELLIKAAEMIKKACRADDIISRTGGDEFSVLLLKTNAEETAKIADLIKLLVSKVEFGNIKLSISCGFDVKESDNQQLIEVMANAENYMYRNKLYEHSSMRSKTIDIIMNTLFEKSDRESLHSSRVSSICKAIASKMTFGKEDINKIGIAGLVHDIGKIGIDEKILNKAGSLSNDEREQIKRHPEIGWRILSSANELSELAQFILDHHERWDGEGYPNGLKGEKIPLVSRIIAVADAYDAMTSERSYRKGVSTEEAIKELKRCSGTQFDPKIVEVFVTHVLQYNNFMS